MEQVKVFTSPNDLAGLELSINRWIENTPGLEIRNIAPAMVAVVGGFFYTVTISYELIKDGECHPERVIFFRATPGRKDAFFLIERAMNQWLEAHDCKITQVNPMMTWSDSRLFMAVTMLVYEEDEDVELNGKEGVDRDDNEHWKDAV